MTPANLEQAAAYDVLVGGESKTAELQGRVEEIRVVDHIKLPDVCTVMIAYDASEIDSQPFEIGKELEVQLGPNPERAPTTLFKGDIVTLEPEFGASGCRLTVRALDKAHQLMRSRRVDAFQGQSTSEIVTKVVKKAKAGLTVQVDASDDSHDYVLQANQTDWEFIWYLAERIGFEAVASGSVLHFRRPSADSTVELEWPGAGDQPDHGRILRSFKPRVTAVQQVSKVSLLAHDPLTKKVIESTAVAPQQSAEIGLARDDVTRAFADSQIHIATESVESGAHGKRLVQGVLDKHANDYAGVEGSANGNPRIKAGTKVEISGVGKEFGGTYRVATATHVLGTNVPYMTWFSSSPTHTILAAVGAHNNRNGGDAPLFATQLVLGIVTSNKDPKGLGRVRVSYPALGEGTESAWARIASTSAGKERGLMMLPVEKEEVLIGFEHGNPNRPYVLGSLFNGQDVPGRLLQLNDGTFALVSDKRIYTESIEDFTIKSGGRLAVEIAGKVEESFDHDWTNKTSGRASLTADQQFDIQGRSVAITGSTGVTVRGTGGTLTLECGGSKITLSKSGVKISGAGAVTIDGAAVTSGSPVAGTFKVPG
jgi:phage protein D